MKKLIGVVAIFIASTELATAQPIASDMVARRKELITQVIINSSYSGLAFANAYLENNGRARLFCQPDDLALSPEQMIDLIEGHIRRSPANTKMPAVGVLLQALQESFPCRNSN